MLRGWHKRPGRSPESTRLSHRRARLRRLLPAGAAVLPLLCATAAHSQLIGSCTISVGPGGALAPSADLSSLGSRQPGGRPARVEVTASSLICTVVNPLDCYSITIEKPGAFDLAPPGGGDNVTFDSIFRLESGAAEYPAGVPLTVANGIHRMEIELEASKSGGVFPAGAYRASVTVLCE